MTNQINELLKESIDSIRHLVDVSIVIGNPIIMNNHQVIPISKVKYGFISGGADQTNSPIFGANAGTVSLTPIALIVNNQNDVKVLHLDTSTHTFEYLVDNVVDLVEEVIKKIKKDA